jgi:hypothetical protein
LSERRDRGVSNEQDAYRHHAPLDGRTHSLDAPCPGTQNGLRKPTTAAGRSTIKSIAGVNQSQIGPEQRLLFDLLTQKRDGLDGIT